MRLDFSGERVLAVVAHPDNAEMLCGGTLARAKADGAAIGICILCLGDQGQPVPPVQNLAEVRRMETQDSAAILGAELMFGGFPDGELFDGTAERHKVIEMLRHFRPTLILTHGPQDYHPDHRATSALTEVASWYGASRSYHTSTPAVNAPAAIWCMDTINMSGFEPGFFVDITDQMELKVQMLACHQTQLRRGDRAYGSLEELMHQQSRVRGSQAGVAAAEAFCIPRSWKRKSAW